jgi:hypothetical protein
VPYYPPRPSTISLPLSHTNPAQLTNVGINTHTQLDTAVSDLNSHLIDFANPHLVTAAQAGADPAGTSAAGIAAHVALADPHIQYGPIPSQRSLFSVYQSVSQAIPAGVSTVLTFTTKLFDVLNEVSAAGIFTCTYAGYYIFSGSVQGTQAAICIRLSTIYVNGIATNRLGADNGSTGATALTGTTKPILLNIGDIVDVRYVTVIADNTNATQVITYFGGYRLL